MSTRAYISLGSNLGDRRAILDAALDALTRVRGVELGAVSSYQETSPVGGPPDQGPFLNAAARLFTTLSPRELLVQLQRIEAEAGRVRVVRWGERTLDLDLLVFGSTFLDEPDLQVPHPRLAFRRFALAPLAEIAPSLVDPGTMQTIAALLANLDRRPRFLAIDGPPGPNKAALFRRLVDELPGFALIEADVTSPPLSTADPAEALLDPLRRKADALRPVHWPTEELRVPWIVADFFFDFDVRLTAESRWWTSFPRSEWIERRESFQVSLLDVSTRPTLTPTLAVILPGDPADPRSRRAPFQSSTPLLRPDSGDGEALAAEVLATCRSIQED
jgi:2-amino-4-hydroxy-6-hydroxymethyldihydropteridine diphosphokinase